jgi:APA family basic amino acid/polyamine antiporter
LRRVVGVTFGLAVIVGGTVGVGILRTPGEVAAQLGAPKWILGIWALGGLYVILGAMTVAELGTMLPQAGGFYVYARRALGDGVGLMVGASDWLGQTTALAFAAVTMGEYVGVLVPALTGAASAVGCALILATAGLQAAGLRASGRVVEWTTLAKALAFTALILACFVGREAAPSRPVQAPGDPRSLVRLFLALGSVMLTYDGWYCAIYFTEEDRNPGENLPRSMIGGALVVTSIYLLFNAALLRVLGTGMMAGSAQPAADAVARIAGTRAGHIVTALSILSLVPLINAVLLLGARILFAAGRDHGAPGWLAGVNSRGTPTATWATAAAGCVLAATGTFSRLAAVAAFLFVVNHCSGFVSMLVLRRREGERPRPFRAPLHPWVPLAALAGGVSYLAGALLSDFKNSAVGLALVLSYPAYRMVRRILSN